MKVLIDQADDKRLTTFNQADFWVHGFEQNGVDKSDINTFNYDNYVNVYLYLANNQFNTTFNVYKRANKKLFKKLSQTKYDIIMFSKGEYMTHRTIGKIRYLQKPNTVIINFFPDNPFYYQNVLQTIKHYDMFFVKDTYFLEELKKLGFSNVHYLPQAYSSKYHVNLDMGEEKEKSVSIIGSVYPKRYVVLGSIDTRYLNVFGNYIWQPCRKKWIKRLYSHKVVTGLEKSYVIDDAKINLNTHHPINDINGTNSRTFEVCACGGFLLTEYKKDLDKLFRIGKEIVVYHNITEMQTKIDYYLAHEKERRRIAKAGYKRAIKEHSYTHRVKTILQMISKNKAEVNANGR